MNITRENVDALNTVIKVDIVKDDYQEKVTKILKDYRKKADVPGFRKGHIPMGIIKKQYGQSIMVDEVNKLIQESLSAYLEEEKLDFLGNPIPRMQEDLDWNAGDFSFEFEIGIAPKFEIDLTSKSKIKQYAITADKDLIDKEVENIQTRYGKMSAIDAATEEANITGVFVNEEKEIDNKSTFSLKDIKGKINLKKLVGSKIGDIIELKAKGLFTDEHKLQNVLDVSHEDVHGLDVTVQLTIEDVTKTELAALDQELFDKLFPQGGVATVTELRDKIKEDAEKQFEQQADQQLLNAITEYLIENTKFDLPTEFLTKWLQTAGEKELTQEEAVEEYTKSEKGLRYQLIEAKIMKDNDIKLDYAELVAYAKGFIRSQMAQFGNVNPEEKELDDIAARILQNKDEAQKLHSQLISQKMFTFFKENMTFKTKEVTYVEFIKEVYK